MKPRRRPQTALATLCTLTFLLAACSGGGGAQEEIDQARASIANKESRAAVLHLKNALQKDPKRAEARFMLGQLLLESGDAAGAAVELYRALEWGHPAESALPVLSRALLAQGEYRKLVVTFGNEQLKLPEAAADLKTSIAKAYLATGEKTMARQALQAALHADPGHVPARVMKALMLQGDGEHAAALEVLRIAVDDAPKDTQAWVTYGDLLAMDKTAPAPAAAAYGRAIALQPDGVAAHSGLITLWLDRGDYARAQTHFEALKQALPEHRRTLYFGTVLALQRKDYKAARELADKLMAAAPSRPENLRVAGVVALQAGDLRKAEGLLAGALHAAPGDAMLRRLMASTYLQTGQPEKALATVQPLLDGDAPGAEVLTLAAMANAQTGELKQAQTQFAAAARLNPSDERTRAALALTRLSGPAAEPALAELQSIVNAATDPRADYALVSALTQRREFDKALHAVDALQRKQGDAAAAEVLRGRVQLARGDGAAARAAFERALAGKPAYYPATEALASMDLSEGKPEAAIKRFEALLQQEPKNASALLALAALRERQPGGPEVAAGLLAKAAQADPTRTSARMALIEHHLRQRAFKAAVAAAQDAVAALPSDPTLLDALGRSHLSAGDAQQALTAFNRLAAQQPQAPLPQLRLAQAHLAMKNPAAAEKALVRATTLKPGYAPAVEALVGLQLQQSRLDDALAVARDLRKQRPESAAGYALEADIHASRKNWDSAASALRAGIAREPQRKDLAMKLYSALQTGSKRAEADAFATHWVKAHPDDGAFVLYAGEDAMVRGDYPSAETRFLAVARLDPRNAVVQNNLAWLTIQRGKPGALAYAERANTLKPGQPAFLDTLASALAHENRVPEALSAQKQALQLQPANAQLRLHLAELYLRAGDKPQARSELDALSRLGPGFGGHAQVEQLMKTL